MARRKRQQQPPGSHQTASRNYMSPVLPALLLPMLLTGLMLAGCAGSSHETLPEPAPRDGSGDAAQASKDCATPTGIAAMVCEQDELTALDQKLNEVMQDAIKHTHSDEQGQLQAIQNSWLRQRDDCTQQADPQRCVREAYQQRIAQLQARHGLVEQRGPLNFICKGRMVSEVSVTWFDTTPETLIAQRGDSQSLMVRQAGESVYRGRNESLSEQGEAITLVWGHGAPQITCQAAR